MGLLILDRPVNVFDNAAIGCNDELAVATVDAVDDLVEMRPGPVFAQAVADLHFDEAASAHAQPLALVHDPE